jgi:hypothetical protein
MGIFLQGFSSNPNGTAGNAITAPIYWQNNSLFLEGKARTNLQVLK